MDNLRSLSESLAELAATAAKRLFYVPSPLGGRTALGFDGSHLLVPALEASEGEALEVLAPGGKPLAATVVGFDPRLSLAVLGLSQALPDSAWKAAPGLPALGSLVLVAAFPSPQGSEVRLDAVRFAVGEGEEAYIQTDGSRFPGFSGSALVDPDGALSGFLLSDAPGNRGWAIPGSRAAALAASIVARGFPGRAWLGISSMPVETPPGYSELFGDDREGGLIIAGLEPDGPAAKAGALVGDILVSIGGRATASPAGLREAIDALDPGAETTIALIRAGARRELKVLPASRKDDYQERGHGWGWGRGWGHGHGHGQGHHHGQGCGCGR
jgi:serine protease DegS